MLDKQEILKKAYDEMGLTFEFDDRKHLYVKLFDSCYFMNNIGMTSNNTEITNPGICLGRVTGGTYVVRKGKHVYYYCNIYEVLLWYHYYTIKYKHIQHKNKNTSYFSRIPPEYRNIDPKRGLNIVKSVLDKIIVENNGVPKYYNKLILDQIFTVI